MLSSNALHVKKKFQYKLEHLQNAYNAVKEEKISIFKAAKRFGVPYSTLKDKVNGKSPLLSRKYVFPLFLFFFS